MEALEFDYDFHKNYELCIKKDVYKNKGLCGIINLGNKCYIDSILQCLSNSLKLTDYLLSGKYKEDLNITVHKNEHYLLNSYITFVNHVWDENQLIKPKSIIENLSKFHKKYYGVQQHDSHECLLYFLDILHHAMSYEIEIDINGEINCKKDELMKKSLDTWKLFFEKEYSFIIELFYGNMINIITCSNCNFSEEIFEPFNNLSLSLTDNTLQKCLDNYFNNYCIETWKCELCFNNGCNKFNKIWSLPNYLIIHLKRFNNENKDTIKNTELITFPIKDLNLTKYISKDKQDMNNYIYDLYAINYHNGNLNNGHYWSACKNMNGYWYNYNDGDVSRYNHNNTDSQLITKDAYILMYHRKFIKSPLQI